MHRGSMLQQLALSLLVGTSRSVSGNFVVLSGEAVAEHCVRLNP